MTVWRQPEDDFKHVERGEKVLLDLCALEATRNGLVMRDLGIQKLICALLCRWASSTRRGGMTVLGKVAVPKPINLPSQRYLISGRTIYLLH